MHVATSVIEDQPLRATPAEGETLYEFSQSPLLERQSRQESNARSYPRRIPLALKKARGLLVEDVEGRTFIDCLAGAGTLRLMFVCVLPNCMAPLIVQATLSFSSAILDAAALGFLGLGVQPPTPEWGTMLASARDYIERAWWVVSLPGLTILLSVLAINLMGDGLRDALDPKLKNAA